MSTAPYIPLATLCTLYKVERSFFKGLNDNGLIEITTIEHAPCIHHDQIKNLEAIVRLHQDLHINFEGIDTVLNLLDKITQLQEELRATKNRLRIFED
ncbi:chaperone modulator CbpM [Gelidibacter sp. F2691]|nr:chaperone modulator CbpM [Gelidibacter sp. F2691]